MSYSVSISGHVESRKAEAGVLLKVADLVEAIEANGTFSFSGSHFSVFASAPADALAKARAVLAEYNQDADADDLLSDEAEDEVPALEEDLEAEVAEADKA